MPFTSAYRVKRRRALLAAAFYKRGLQQRLETVAVLAACWHINGMRRAGRDTTNIERPVLTFRAMISGIPDKFFRRLYRFPFQLFAKLVDLISPHCEDRIRVEKHTYWIKLSTALRWLAGGSYLNIALSHNVPSSSLYYYIDGTLRSVNDNLELSFPYSSVPWLEDVSNRFAREGRSPLSKCCGALDGLAVKICELTASEVSNSSTYYNRKGFFALNLSHV